MSRRHRLESGSGVPLFKPEYYLSSKSLSLCARVCHPIEQSLERVVHLDLWHVFGIDSEMHSVSVEGNTAQ